MSVSSSTLTAKQVMFHNGADSSGRVGTITVSGGGAVTMPRPKDTYDGMAIFQDRSARTLR